MKQAEKALRDAGWEEINLRETRQGDEVYDLDEHDTYVINCPALPTWEGRVLRAPRPEPEYGVGTIARIKSHATGREVNAIYGAFDSWYSDTSGYAASEVEVLRVIAYSDGTTPQIKQMGIGFTRIEVIDESGRAYVNTSARDVDVALEDDGRALKVFTGGVGVTPRPTAAPRPGDSFGQCTPDVDAINERIKADLRQTLKRLYEDIDGKDQP